MRARHARQPSAQPEQLGDLSRTPAPPRQRLAALLLLIALVFVVVPAAALIIGELPPVERATAWHTFRLAMVTGLVGGVMGAGWQWLAASRQGWTSSTRSDRIKMKYVVGACGGVGLLLSELAAGTRGVVLFGFSAGFLPIFFIALYAIEKRRRTLGLPSSDPSSGG